MPAKAKPKQVKSPNVPNSVGPITQSSSAGVPPTTTSTRLPSTQASLDSSAAQSLSDLAGASKATAAALTALAENQNIQLEADAKQSSSAQTNVKVTGQKQAPNVPSDPTNPGGSAAAAAAATEEAKADGISTCDSKDPVVIERFKALQRTWEAYVAAHNVKSLPSNSIAKDSLVFHFHEEDSKVDRRPVLVVSCDGGGVRGAASAAAIAQIEAIWAEEAKKTGIAPPPYYQLCNWELFAGTSTGSFVAGMLAACNASGEAIVDMYRNQASVMMPPRCWWNQTVSLFSQALYTNAGKEQVLQGALVNKRTGKQKKMKHIKNENRQLLVCAYRVGSDPGLHVFDSTKEPEIPIWQVCNASSAAPTYFSAIVVNNQTFIDGGLALNNPTLAALNAAKVRSEGHRPVFVLSIGTGSKPANMGADVGSVDALRDGVTDFVTDCYSQALLAKDYCEAQGWKYIRLDGDLGAASEAMDDVSAGNVKCLDNAGRLWATKQDAELRAFLHEIEKESSHS